MAFDAAKARDAGYSDTEIADYLAKDTGFKVEDARKSGYTDEEITSHLVGMQQEADKPLNKIKKFGGEALDAIKSGVTKLASDSSVINPDSISAAQESPTAITSDVVPAVADIRNDVTANTKNNSAVGDTSGFKSGGATGSDEWIKQHEERYVPPGDFDAISKELGGSMGKGNINLDGRNVYVYTDPKLKGDFSSLESITIEDNGKNVLIPKVTADGRMLTEDQAIKEYKKSGKYLGKFDTDEEATKYAIALERRQNAYYENGPGKDIRENSFRKSGVEVLPPEKPQSNLSPAIRQVMDSSLSGQDDATKNLAFANAEQDSKKTPNAYVPLTDEERSAKESELARGFMKTTPGLDIYDAMKVAKKQVRDEEHANTNAMINTVAPEAPPAYRAEFAKEHPNVAGVVSGVAGMEQGLADTVPLAIDTITQTINPFITHAGGKALPDSPRLPGAGYLDEVQAGYRPEIANKKWSSLKGIDETTDWLAAQAAIQSPQLAGSFGASLLPKVRGLYLGAMGAMSSGQQFNSDKQAQLDHHAAVADAWVNGGIEILSEMLPLHVFDKIKTAIPRMNLAQRAGLVGNVLEKSGVAAAALAGQTIPEGASEAVAQVGQNASQKYIGGDKSVDDITSGWQDAAVIGALMGTPLGVHHSYDIVRQGQAIDKARGAINLTLNTDTQLKLHDDELAKLKAVADQVNAYVPDSVDVPKIDAEIARRANLGTLSKASEVAQRNDLRNAETVAPDAIPAQDILGDENVSQPNAPHPAGVVTEPGQPTIDNGVGSAGDQLSGEQPGDPGVSGVPDSSGRSSTDSGLSGVVSGSGATNTSIAPDIAGDKIDHEWTKFTPESGTKGIPREVMPQIKAEHRGAMVNFLNARGITHQAETVPADTLKPTQAEFSPAKVEKAIGFDGNNRSILVSSDNHVLDGHHQWLAKRQAGENVDVIRLNAPIKELVDQVNEFPSSTNAVDTQKEASNPVVSQKDQFGDVNDKFEPGQTVTYRNQKDDYGDADVGSYVVKGMSTTKGGEPIVEFTNGKWARPEYLEARKTEPEVPQEKSNDTLPHESTALDTHLAASQESPLRPLVEAFTKRRAAAAQIGMEKPFDLALAAAKDLMNGNPVKAAKFKNWASTFKRDATLANLLNQLHVAAKGSTAKVEKFAYEKLTPEGEEALNALLDEADEVFSPKEISDITKRANDYVEQNDNPKDWQYDAALHAELRKALDEKIQSGSTEKTTQPTKNGTSEGSQQPQQEAATEAQPVQVEQRKSLRITGDRRADQTERKRIDDMTTAEMRNELMKDSLTGLNSLRWMHDNADKYSHTIAFDADSLKWVNDNLGHESGDKLLRAWGEALAIASETGARAGGDEFFAYANSEAEANKIVAKVQELLDDAEITAETPDGDVVIKGIGVSFGIGTNRKGADENLNKHKSDREAAGTRAGRGEPPPGLVKPAAKEQQNKVDKSGRQDDQVATDKITDFGEKIHGAKKDIWTGYKDKIEQSKEVDVAAEPLSKSWPEPDYQKLLENGADPYTVAFIHAARDEIPTKPQKSWKLKGWVEKFNALRDFSYQFLNGEKTKEDAMHNLTAGDLSKISRHIPGRIDLYEAVGHDKSLRGIKIGSHRYSLYDGKEHNPPIHLWSVEGEVTMNSRWPKTYATADSYQAAIDKFKEAWSKPVETQKKDVEFSIYSRRGLDGFFIGKKIGKHVAELKSGFPDAKAARTFLMDNREELVNLYQKYKDIPSERRSANNVRIGNDFRDGADVTPEQFNNAFGFRGVQFGNYVEGKRRQTDLNNAYDALMDLAGVLEIPPKALSLDGNLGLAFGARGSGGKNAAAAHYEAGSVVINLTKGNGAGSLAHEWFHAMDNYFSRKDGKSTGFLTESLKAGDSVRPEMVQAFNSLMKAINASGLKQRSQELDKRRTKDYWGTGLEMAARSFESYVINKLQDQNASNDYLANIVSDDSFGIDGGYPYPTAGEIPAIRAAFDNFFQTLETKESDKGVTLFSRNNSTGRLSKEDTQAIVDDISKAWPNGPEIVVVSDMNDEAVPKEVREENERQLSQGASGQPLGFFEKGKVYVVASEMSSPKSVATVLYHEILGHFGLQGAFGKSLNPILDQIYMTRRADVLAKAKEYGLDFKDAGERRYAAEEVLAEMAQANPQLGFVKRAVAAIRNWLRTNIPAFKDLKFTDVDIINNFLLPARAFVQRGGKAGSGKTAFQRVWHGSPHKFEKFSTSHIGTGEGAQAYGWGIYFAGKKEIAEHYRTNLSHTQIVRDFQKELPDDADFDEVMDLVGTGHFTEYQDRVLKALNSDDWLGFDYPSQAISAAFKNIDNYDPSPELKKAINSSGQLYHAEIPEDDSMLLWDKPLSEQPKEVLAALKKIDSPIVKESLQPFELGNTTGEGVYRALMRDMADKTPEVPSWTSVNQTINDTPGSQKDASLKLNSLGIKGIKYLDATSRKSGDGSYNYVVFDDGSIGDTKTHFSRSNSTSWSAPVESKIDNLIYSLQDKHVDLKRVTKAIKETAGELDDRWNAYLQEELYHGRAAKRTEDFLKQELEPLIEDMRNRGVKMPEFEEYLWARHAEERNKQIASINPEMQDGGSGMKTADAKEYLANLKPAQKSAYEALAKRIDAINQKSRQVLVDYGLESADTIKAWEGAYKHYVPLMREDMDTGFGNGTGQGFSIKGNSTKRALGSGRAVVDILANIAMQREKNIIRGEKNRVSTALVGLAKLNPNNEFWKVDTPPTIKGINKSTNQVEERQDPNYKNRDNVVIARIPDKDGNIQERSVIFNEHDERAMRMAASLKNLDADQIGQFLGAVGTITRYFAAINTQYNPIFGLVNLTRDVQGSLLNLTSTPIAGKQKQVMALTGSALRGIYKEMRAERKGKEVNTQWSKLWEEFQCEGGQTGYRDQFRNSKERAAAIEQSLDPEWWQKTRLGKVITAGGLLNAPEKLLNDKAVKPVFEWLSDYNEAMENAVRLSTYKVGLDNGMTKQQAASLAKNISVNFNRKGQAGRQINSLYAFFNASVQGSARIAETLKGPAGRKIIIGGLLLGAMQAVALSLAGFGDDEPPEFMRDRNLIIPIGGKKYITIPLPLGFNAIPNLGRILTEYAMDGGTDTGKRLVHIFTMLMDVTNPLGGSGHPANLIMPTVGDPLVDLARNKDFSGRDISRKDFNSLDPTPGFTRGKDTSSAIGMGISKIINYLTGGTDYKPGAVSPTPDDIDYLIGQATGGVGREAMKVEQLATSLVTGEDLPTYKIPIVGKFYGDADSKSSQGAAFYKNITEMNEHENQIKGMRKNHEDVSGYKKENPETTLIFSANLAEKQVSALRKRERAMVEKGDKDKVQAINDRITTIMTRFNEKVKARKNAEQPSQ